MTSVTSAASTPASIRAGQLVNAKPAASESWQSQRGVVPVGTAAGLLVVSLGYSWGWAGRSTPARVLFFSGVLIIFAVSAWKLLAAGTRRKERIVASVAQVVGLTVASFLASPLLFTGYDELLHQVSLWQWATHRGVLAHNSLMPISVRYPGLEALTLGFRWLTGLPIGACEMATVLVSRVVLVLALFFVVERLTSSARAAGAAVVVYSASPQFYSFNAAFSYQTLALATGCACVYLLLRSIDQKQVCRGQAADTSSWFLWLSVVCCLVTVVTHHLIGWVTVGFLGVCFLVLRFTGRRSEGTALVGTVAGIGLLGATSWTLLNSSILIHYLRPILGTSVNGFEAVFGGRRRTLFQGAGTFKTPAWERAVMLGSAAVVSTVLVVAIWAVLTRRVSLRGGPLRWIAILGACGYGVVLLSHLAANSAELGERLSTFVFFGVALLVGAWYARIGTRVRLAAVIGAASVCFLGGLLLGSGPDWLYVPGSYAGPSADQGSIDGSSLAAARWAAEQLPPGSTVAADRDNAVLMAAVGHLSPESEASGGINVGPLYFAPTWGPADTAAVRRSHIRYLLVDQRLATGPPAFGVYFEAGESRRPQRLTQGELSKFAHVEGMHRIYDNGAIQIYDLAGLLHLPAPSTPAGLPRQPSEGPDWLLIAGSAAVTLIWGRRWSLLSAEDLLVRVITTTVIVMGCAVVIFFTPLPTVWLGAAFLGVFAMVGIWGEVARHRPAGVRPWWPFPTGRRGVLVVVATATLTCEAAIIAVASAASALQVPPR